MNKRNTDIAQGTIDIDKLMAEISSADTQDTQEDPDQSAFEELKHRVDILEIKINDLIRGRRPKRQRRSLLERGPE